MAGLAERSTSVLMLDLVFAALRVRDERVHTLAIELFGRFGADLVPRLAIEAVNRKNPLPYRLRALKAIGRIGSVTDPADFLALWSLLGDRDALIRQAAADLILALRPDTGTRPELSIVPGPPAAPTARFRGGSRRARRIASRNGQ
jgi:hypothetical protein